MAISNNGGSAASRFRGRGTGLSPSVGLGRRNLLAEDEGPGEATAEDTVNTIQEAAAARTSRRLGARFAQTEAPEGEAPDSEAVVSDQLAQSEPAPAAMQRTETEAPDPAPVTPRRRRGRPAKKAVAVQSDSQDGSVYDTMTETEARARMREIAQQAKALRNEHEALLESIQRDFEDKNQPLRTEYEELSNHLTRLTFGN